MSTTIENRVVEMRFDNQHFEKNVQTSMSTLDKLKQKLNLTGASKGLENVNDAAKKVDMNGLGSGVEAVAAKFSALQVMGVTALANITNSAVNAGKRIVSALTIDPVKTGFSEYETKINSIQTIMSNTASKGTTMADVTKVIDELNTYADKTIYNFAEMTRNIGTFTAAGVGLEESAAAIKGIANLAAASGSTSQQASTAMYQLSQALSTGTVRLMDWNSVVNAGMGGEKFQEALKATAREYGVAVDDIIKKNGSFRDSLQDGWLSADILNETLNKFTVDGATKYAKSMMEYGKWTKEQADALIKEAQSMEDAATKVKTFTQLMDTLKESLQSGWGKTWELIFGDFEEAREFFTGLSDMFSGMIDKASDARNSFLESGLTSPWKKLSKEIDKTGISVEEFQNGLIETAKAHGIAVDEMIEESGSFEKSLKKGWLGGDIITETLNKMIGVTDEATDSISNVSDKLEDLSAVAKRVMRGEFGNGADRIKKLTEAGYEYAAVQEIVNKMVAGEAVEVKNLSDAQLENLGYTKEQIEALRELATQAEKTGTPINELINNMSRPSGRELFLSGIMNVLGELQKILDTIAEAWDKVFGDWFTSEDLYKIAEGFNKFTEDIKLTDTAVANLSTTIEGLFRALELAALLSSGTFAVLKKIWMVTKNILGVDLLGITARIGQMIIDFRNWLVSGNALATGLQNVGHKIVGFVEGVVRSIREWIKEFSELPIVQKFIESFASEIDTTFDKLSVWFDNLVLIFGNFIDTLTSMEKLDMSSIGKALKGLWDNVKSHFSNIGNAFDGLFKIIKDFKDSIVEHFGGVGDAVDGLLEKILNFGKKVKDTVDGNFGFAEFMSLLIGTGFIVGLIKIGKALLKLYETFTAIPKGIEAVSKSLSSMFDTFGDSAKLIAKSIAIRNIAIAIAILSGSLMLLAQLEWSEIGKGLAGLAGIIVLFGGLAFALDRLDKLSFDFQAGSITILALAGAVALLAGSLKIMDTLDQDKLLYNLGAIGLLMIGLATAVGVLGKFVPMLSAGSVGFISFAAALYVLVHALKDLDDLDLDGKGKTVGALIGILTTLGVVSVLCSGMKIRSAVGFLTLVLSLKVLMMVLEDLCEFNMEKMKANLESIATIFGLFALLMVAGSVAGPNMAKAGVGIIAMSAALLLIIQSFKALSKFEGNELTKVKKVISEILLIFSLIVAVSHFAGQYAMQAGVMLMLMSGAMLVLSASIAMLAHVPTEGLDRAVDAISQLMIIFGLIIAATKYATDVNKTVLMMAVTIGVLAVSIGMLGMLKDADIASATAAMTTVMLAFSAMITSVSALKDVNKVVGKLLVLTLIVGAIAGIITMVAVLNPESALDAALSISALLLAISTSIVILSNAGMVAPTAYTSLGVMVAVVAGLAVIIGVLAACNVGPTLEIAQSLSILLLALSGACAILSYVGTMAGFAVAGTVALMAVIVGVGGLMLAIGALVTYFPKLQEFLDNGIPVLEKIGYGLGTFFGSIIGGFSAGAASGLPEIATYLSEFATNLAPFLTTVGGIEGDVLSGISTLAEAFLILTGAGLIDRLTSGLFGISSLSSFSLQLVPFGKNFAKFAESIKNVDVTAVEGTANAAKALAEMADVIPKVGGVVAVFQGENSLTNFGTQLIPFGRCLRDYATVVSSIDETAITSIENSAKAAQSLVDVASAIPSDGAFGTDGIDDFGRNIVSFGNKMKEYGNAVKDIDAASITASVTAASNLKDIANELPDDGKTGMDGIDDFGRNIVVFGNAMRSYSSIVSQMDFASISASITSVNRLKSMIAGMAGMDASGVETFSTALSKLGETSIDGFISTFSSASTQLSSVGSNLVQSLVSGIILKQASVAAAGKGVLTAFMSGISSQSSVSSSVINSIINNMMSIAKSRSAAFKSIGSGLMAQFASGMKSQNSAILSAATSALSSAASGMRGYYGSFYSAGYYVATGFANGISSGAYQAVIKARAMAQAAYQAAKQALNINSPSKLFRTLGKSVPEGFALGIGMLGDMVKGSSVSMAEAAIDSTKSALSRISDIITSDVDTQPTIRPVMDLSDIESGANTISSLFGSGMSVGAYANVGAISTMMNRRQNGNSDVISAIDSLRKSMGNVGGNTYIIDGVTYDDGSNIANAMETIVRAARMDRRR